jgi:hypothetical protein
MTLTINNLDKLTPAEDEAFWVAFESELMHDDGAAAKEHLAAGFPIYFRDADTPAGLVIKEYPDGRRELVYFDLNGEKVVQAAA